MNSDNLLVDAHAFLLSFSFFIAFSVQQEGGGGGRPKGSFVEGECFSPFLNHIFDMHT
jgi:hypothetical protein